MSGFHARDPEGRGEEFGRRYGRKRGGGGGGGDGAATAGNEERPAHGPCERCRLRKTRCDGQNPCSSCRRVGVECVRSRRQERKLLVSETYITDLEDRVKVLEPSHPNTIPDPQDTFGADTGSVPTETDTWPFRRALVLLLATFSLLTIVVGSWVPAYYLSKPSPPNELLESTFFFQAWISTISVFTFMLAWLVNYSTIRILRPKIKSDCQRLEWTCSCGKSMWGDYFRGVHTMSQLIRNLPNCTSFTSSGDTGLQQSGSSSSGQPSSAAQSNRPSIGPGSASDTTPISFSTTDHREFHRLQLDTPAYFELCVNRGSDQIQLCEILLTDAQGRKVIYQDMAFFAEIRKQYNSHRKRSIRSLLYRPHDIHFVQFGVLRAGVQTGIYDKPLAIPPALEVKEKRYHYYECPLDPLPPMDRRTFFHYFWEHDRHPPPGGNPAFESLFFNRLPKKLGESIFNQKEPKLQLGWGVHIIEGPNKPMLAWLASAILVLSFIVSLSYDIGYRKKESGFAIGQWMVAVLGTMLTALYFHLADIA